MQANEDLMKSDAALQKAEGELQTLKPVYAQLKTDYVKLEKRSSTLSVAAIAEGIVIVILGAVLALR